MGSKNVSKDTGFIILVSSSKRYVEYKSYKNRRSRNIRMFCKKKVYCIMKVIQ